MQAIKYKKNLKDNITVTALDSNCWVLCGNCGAKLLKKKKENAKANNVEIKCHNCKALNEVNL